MDAQLKKIDLKNKQKLSDLLDVYRSELFLESKEELGPYKYLDNYFTESNRHPLFIEVYGKVVGFALVNLKDPLSNGEKQAISEFYVIPEYRNRGVGKIAAKQIFDMFPGDWAIRELENNPAENFWRKIISEYTNGQFEEIEQNDEKWKGKVQLFNNQVINDLVKKGYERIADDYATKRNQFESIEYLETFSKLIEKGKTILDVGCGAGKPVDEFLAKQGFAVNGIDISPRMITLARKNVPEAFYEIKDISNLKDFEYCVDGIVSFYAIFHTPREKHQELFKRFATFMPKGGVILVTMGADDWEGTEKNFHGAEMFWSHYGPDKNKEMLEKAGFEIILNEIKSSGEKHQVIIAKK